MQQQRDTMWAQRFMAIGRALAPVRDVLRANRHCTHHLSRQMQKEKFPIFKRFEDGFIIRALRREELDIIIADFNEQNKGFYTHERDTQMFWDCADPVPGAHFFAGEVDGTLVTGFYCIQIGPAIHAGSGSYTHPDFRGKGHWTRLHKWFLDQKPTLLVCGMYTKFLAKQCLNLGYQLRHNTLMWRGSPDPADRLPDGLVDANLVPLEKLHQYDASHFLYPKAPIRKRLLQQWSHVDEYKALVALDSQQDIVGYAVRRPAIEGNFALGPWYADDVDVAERLLLGVTCGMPQGATLYTENWEPNEEAKKLLEKYNFEVIGDLIYTTYGIEYGILRPWVFGVTSEDFMQG